MSMLSLLLASLFIWLVIKPLTMRLLWRLFPEAMGRRKVRQLVNNHLYPEYHRLVEDAEFTTKEGTTYRIPQLLISRYGIFIISLCHMKYRIYGSRSTTCWFSRKKDIFYQFDNPHRQLSQLKYDFCETLVVPPYACHSIVLFTSHSAFDYRKLERTGSVEDLIKILNRFHSYEVGTGSIERLARTLQKSSTDITTDIKTCIINADYLTPRTAN